MKEIKLGKSSYVALVDDEDFEYLNQWKWQSNKKGNLIYVVRRELLDDKYANGNRKTTKVSMHRVIMNLTDKKMFVDHINHNGLDNQRSNLRNANSIQNSLNKRKCKAKSSKYKGVCWGAFVSRWRVGLHLGKKYKHIGQYDCEIEAAKAYDSAATFYFGEFAYLNFPLTPLIS